MAAFHRGLKKNADARMFKDILTFMDDLKYQRKDKRSRIHTFLDTYSAEAVKKYDEEEKRRKVEEAKHKKEEKARKQRQKEKDEKARKKAEAELAKKE